MLGQTLFALTALAGIVVAAPAQSQARTIENVEWTVKNFTRGLELSYIPTDAHPYLIKD
jgi:hypothetical protein